MTASQVYLMMLAHRISNADVQIDWRGSDWKARYCNGCVRYNDKVL
jgi:hypothetical protein